MKCLACKSENVVEAMTSYFTTEKGRYLIVENVPCRKCLQCGEEFFKGSILAAVEALVSGSKSGIDKVSVLNYKKTA